MPLEIGHKFGSYEIAALLGKGGMGEVYRAHDSKLKRDVAIKILPEEFSRDHDRVSRFQREAEVLASLNHANIASIYEAAHMVFNPRREHRTQRPTLRYRSGRQTHRRTHGGRNT
jgi:serine/threonine protein kinase